MGLQQRTEWSKSHDPWRRGASGFCEPQKITVVTAFSFWSQVHKSQFYLLLGAR